MESVSNPFDHVKSPAARAWAKEIRKGDEKETIDALMEYQGLEKIKWHFLAIRHSIKVASIQGRNPKYENYHVILQGNPGTGKTSIARLYNNLLVSLKVVESQDIIEVSGAELATTGPSALRRDVHRLLNYDHEEGVLFIDETYQMLSDSRGKQVLDLILKRMSDKIGKLVIIFAGYKQQMEPFFEYNPGLMSRIPYVFHFSNLTAVEIWQVLIKHTRTNYSELQFEGGDNGIPVQVAVKRLVRGSLSASFGNARSVQTCVRQMVDRQLVRLMREEQASQEGEGNQVPTRQMNTTVEKAPPAKQTGSKTDPCATVTHNVSISGNHSSDSSDNPSSDSVDIHSIDSSEVSSKVSSEEYSNDFSNDFSEEKRKKYRLLTRDDILGPAPGKAFQSQAWNELQCLVGLEEVKESVRKLIGSLDVNYELECQNLPPLEFPLNRVFVGQPGTGKTTVASLYGRILSDLGLLSRHDVVLKTPADFIGSHVGESEEKTRKILEATLGKVLIIDEAYMLDAGDKMDTTNSFKAAVIDTIVANVQGTSHEDRCILLLGYEDNMRNLFKNMNPGLSRRFQAANPWRFTNFSPIGMREILERSMRQDKLKWTSKAFETASDMLKRASTRPDFSNAAEVGHCLTVAKGNYMDRLSKLTSDEKFGNQELLPEDFDPNFKCKESNCGDSLSGTLSIEIVNKLSDYERRGRKAKENSLSDPYMVLPNKIAFKGTPSTGRKTAARALGQIYYNLGFLSSTEVIRSTPADFIAQYVGQTAPKTTNLLERALGKVLIVEGAYGLNHEQYGREAQDEIINFISGLSYPKSIVIILADSAQNMDVLFKHRPALRAHFEEEIVFQDLLPDDCVALLQRELNHHSVQVSEITLHEPLTTAMIRMRNAFHGLQQVPGFQNARDIKHVATKVFMKALELETIPTSRLSGAKFKVTDKLIARSVHEMTEQRRRQFLKMLETKTDITARRLATLSSTGEKPHEFALNSQIHQRNRAAERMRQGTPASGTDNAAGVTSSDIQKDVSAEGTSGNDRTKFSHNMVERSREKKVERELNPAETLTEGNLPPDEVQGNIDRESGVSDEIWLQLESDKRKRKHRELQIRLLSAQERESKDFLTEEEIQRKLEDMGLCVAGFKWIKQSDGYRCAGGSHFVANDQLPR